jgi:hypothetical protein
MKKIAVLALIIVRIVSAAATVFLTQGFFSPQNGGYKVGDHKEENSYVGVTYCGNSVTEAKQLIDKVKDYTNLFILQSGTLQNNIKAITEIGDYAVKSELYFIPAFGINSVSMLQTWLPTYHGQWGSHLLGIYLDDEPGGKMLDGKTMLWDRSDDPNNSSLMTKTADRTISGYSIGDFDSRTSVTYKKNGTVTTTSYQPYSYCLTYYPNGQIIGQDENGTLIDPLPNSLIRYSYEELWDAYPAKTYDQVATLFLAQTNDTGHFVRGFLNESYPTLTSDYALQWYDYQGGYDFVLTEFGWDLNVTQEIALARGAATLYGKDWGAMITWKYNQAPYLTSGDEMYQEMISAYRNGAKYIAIFNYSPDMQGPYGILQQEHFDALQRFWNDMKNGSIQYSKVKADTAFVLPHGYGSGLRNQGDIVWGLWAATEKDQQIWSNLQTALATHGGKLDIIYEDSAYPFAGRYSQVIYWNQTG